MTKKAYGLHPTIWRKLRAKHAGCKDLIVYAHNGLAIGTVYLGRYDSAVYLPEAMDFKAISWKRTIEKTPVDGPFPVSLGPTIIPIGQSTWGF